MIDVAARAGVSQKTVSRVVNGEPHVREELQFRVQDAINDLGFRPNAAARSLVTRRTQRIGIVAFGNTMHGPQSILAAIEAVARADGYSVSMVRTETAARTEVRAALDSLLDQGVEGVVLSEPLNLEGAALVVNEHVAVLTLGSRGLTDRDDEIVVGTDELGGARVATDHLLALGHQTVHHIAGPRAWAASDLRANGWRLSLESRGIVPPAPVTGDWSPRSGFDAMTQLLEDERLTAVFVANDQMAIGAISAVLRSGRTVPRDISIVGFDDLDVTEYLPTPLTTMRQEFDTFARTGMDYLMKTIDGQPPTEVKHVVPASLMIRATTGHPPQF